MASNHHTVPLTRRDFFWDDPFFSNVWEDFDQMRRDFWQDNRDFFKRFEDQFKALESESRFTKESAAKSSLSSLKSSKMLKRQSAGSNEIMNYDRNAGSSALDFDEDFGSFWPRRWLMPRGFFDSEFDRFPDIFSRDFLSSKFKDEVLKVKEDDTKFEVSVDTHGYKPEDLQVRIKDNMVTIEAKNEEKKEETNSKSYSAKHFSRSFTLPQGCKAQSVTSNLSKDGLLLVTAPKIEAVTHQPSRNVPITMKKY